MIASMPDRLLVFAAWIDRVTGAVGRAVMWLGLAVVLIQLAVVLMRYVLGIGSIWMQESILYCHAALFMLAAAWTLREGGHVRVDVFYANASARAQAVIDLIGTVLLLLPFAAALTYLSTPFAARSWAILERSPETSGLPLVFVLKTLAPVFALMLVLQGIALAIRAGLALWRPDVTARD